MTDIFDRLAPMLLAVEGGYTNDPKDPGGETNHGITKAVARDHGYSGPMRDLTMLAALSIYKIQYWSRPGFGRVAIISEAVAAELFDTGVNMGVVIAGRFLQRALNAFNREARDYPDLVVDGQIGNATLDALRAFLAVRGKDGEAVMVRALNALQGARYLEIVEARPASEAYTFGWFLQSVA